MSQGDSLVSRMCIIVDRRSKMKKTSSLKAIGLEESFTLHVNTSNQILFKKGLVMDYTRAVLTYITLARGCKT